LLAAETSSRSRGPLSGPATRSSGDPLHDAGQIVFLSNESEKLMFAHQNFFLRRERPQSTIFPLHFNILSDFPSFRFELIAESEG
jgi:hypothetical protein